MEILNIQYLYLVIAGCFICSQVKAASESKQIYVDGDVILGALFPIHHKHEKETLKCGEIWEQYGIQRIEALLLVLEQINNDTKLLPNVKLGCDIRDSCWYTPKALEEAKDFIRSSFFSGLKCEGINSTKPIAGVIGPGKSSVTEDVQKMLAQFQIPEIGYSSTSITLSNTDLYPYFLRVVSPDSEQAKALADLVTEFGWTYISAIYSEGTYGSKGIQQFEELIVKRGKCLAAEAMISSSTEQKAMDGIIDSLIEHASATVIVCFCDGDDVKKLLEALERREVDKNFTIIASDGWNTRQDVVRQLEEAARGSFSIQLASPPYKPFEEHYLSLNPHNNKANVWFREFWEDKFKCSFKKSGNVPHCSGTEDLSKNFSADGKIGFVVDALYTAAIGLDNMINDHCPDKKLCSALKPWNGTMFYEYLLKVNFTTYSSKRLHFDNNGDPPAKYQVMNYQRFPNNTYGYVQIAMWEQGHLEMNSNIQWKTDDNIQPVSLCSKECPKGHAKRQQKEVSKCCWHCEKCPANAIITLAQDCHECEKGSWPNDNLTVCVLMTVEHIEWTDIDALLPFTCALVGISLAIGTIVVFARNNSTAIVKASTRELSYLILVGILLAYISTIAFIIKPTIASCYITRILPGLSFSMIYGSVLTKTNRIARILARGKKKIITNKPKCMTTTSLVMVTITLVTIELAIIVSILIWQPATTEVHYHQPDRPVLECQVTIYGILGPLGFDFFLIGLCTFYAINTRNVPANFNEAKFIGFCMYVTCVIWIAFVPLYFGSQSKIITITLCISLSATVALMLLFWPKLYVIIWHPEKNHRAEFTTTTEVRCHVGQRSTTVNNSVRRYSYGLVRNSKQNTEADIGYGSDAATTCDDVLPFSNSPSDADVFSSDGLTRRSISCQVDFDKMPSQQQIWHVTNEECCMIRGCTHVDELAGTASPPCYKSVQHNPSRFPENHSFELTENGRHFVHRRCVSLKNPPSDRKSSLTRKRSYNPSDHRDYLDLDYIKNMSGEDNSSSAVLLGNHTDSFSTINSRCPTNESLALISATVTTSTLCDKVDPVPTSNPPPSVTLQPPRKTLSWKEAEECLNRRKLFPSCNSSPVRNGYVDRDKDETTPNNTENRLSINNGLGENPSSENSSIEELLANHHRELSESPRVSTFEFETALGGG